MEKFNGTTVHILISGSIAANVFGLGEVAEHKS